MKQHNTFRHLEILEFTFYVFFVKISEQYSTVIPETHSFTGHRFIHCITAITLYRKICHKIWRMWACSKNVNT